MAPPTGEPGCFLGLGPWGWADCQRSSFGSEKGTSGMVAEIGNQTKQTDQQIPQAGPVRPVDTLLSDPETFLGEVATEGSKQRLPAPDSAQ